MKKEQPSYYAIIPANVRYDKHIPAGAKLLYGEVTALSNQKGYCFASNGYFSELYGCTPQAISKWFKRLEAAGYVRISYHGEPGNQERRVSISVDSYQPQLRGLSTTVEGLSTTVEHNNTSILIQERIREGAPQQSETLTGLEKSPPPGSAQPPAPEAFFAPDKHERAAEEIIRYLEENRMYLNGMENGDWRRAVRGHCLKLQKQQKWNDLAIPTTEGQYFSWIGSRIAGAKSWYQVAAEYDKNEQNRTNVSTTPRKEDQGPRRLVSEETHRRAFALTLAELGITGGEE